MPPRSCASAMSAGPACWRAWRSWRMRCRSPWGPRYAGKRACGVCAVAWQRRAGSGWRVRMHACTSAPCCDALTPHATAACCRSSALRIRSLHLPGAQHWATRDCFRASSPCPLPAASPTPQLPPSPRHPAFLTTTAPPHHHRTATAQECCAPPAPPLSLTPLARASLHRLPAGPQCGD